MINIKNVTKNYPQRKVINNLDLQFSEGSFTCILGPSGCGKSTLLKLIAGLETPDSGRIDNVQNLRISYVFQDAALIPWLTVSENISLALNKTLALTPTQKEEKIFEILKLVKLEGQEKSFPHELSGGMKMRVSIARALVNEPEVLLMDEPFSALDELVRFDLQEELWQLWKDKKMSIFFVTHAISEAVFLAEKILLFKEGEIQVLPNIIESLRSEKFRSDKEYQDQIQFVTKKVRGELHDKK